MKCRLCLPWRKKHSSSRRKEEKHVDAKTESILPLMISLYFTHCALIITPVPPYMHTAQAFKQAHERERARRDGGGGRRDVDV